MSILFFFFAERRKPLANNNGRKGPKKNALLLREKKKIGLWRQMKMNIIGNLRQMVRPHLNAMPLDGWKKMSLSI